VDIGVSGLRREFVHELDISAVRGRDGGVGLEFFRPQGSGAVRVCGFGPFGVHSGLRIDDWIYQIAGRDVCKMTMLEITASLRGQPRSRVKLKIRRAVADLL
jgi:C-terminal processing protease CtpA/Prc